EVIDRSNQGLIIPGCTEGHAHYFSGTGLNTQLPGGGKSYSEILAVLEEKVKNEGITQFLTFGWETMELTAKRDEGFSFAEEIESIAPGIPVVLLDNSGHSAVCNTTALKRAGLLDNPEVRGGKVYLDKNGKPSGYVGDQAVFYVTDKVITRPLTDEQYRNACLYGMNKLLELGYTNALDAFTNMYDPTALYETLKKMDDDKELKINVAACFNIKSFDSNIYKQRVDEVVQMVKDYSSSHLNPAYIKLFADGVIESGTGWIIDKYKTYEEGKEHGNIIWTQDELNSIVNYANNKDIIIHTHAYGDGACRAMLDAYIYSNTQNNKEFRNCLAHVRNIRLEDVKRAADNKIPVTENLIWHTDFDVTDPIQKAMRDYILGYVPEDIYFSGYPMKTLIENGVITTSSTDAPAAESVEGSIMNVIEVAVTGIAPQDINSTAFGKTELLTVKQALKALTINGAWQLGLEEERGSIKVGKYADFVVLDKNFLDYQGEQLRTIHNAKILNTYFEGEKVYTLKTL
ncbi:MAG: amidohydrolase family protein, partial [Firmicutes bacterium]|nr:amidohydrolase family protein [Candidatus Caballimonas caccae]